MHPVLVTILCVICYFGGFITAMLLHRTIISEFQKLISEIHQKMISLDSIKADLVEIHNKIRILTGLT
jgi:hypothetical protein